jgi:hypothetical protein
LAETTDFSLQKFNQKTTHLYNAIESIIKKWLYFKPPLLLGLELPKPLIEEATKALYQLNICTLQLSTL